jgi:hypothetical protein
MRLTVARYSRLCLGRESDLGDRKIARESDAESQRRPTTPEPRLPSVRLVYVNGSKEATMKYLFTLATVVAAAVLGGVAACGGEERLSREEFSDRLQSIDQQGGELWGRLAQRAEDLKPGEPLPADVKQALRELVDFQNQAAAELEGLNPPEDAEEPVEVLVVALRARTETFEQAMEAGRFTEQDSERVTQSGEEIDQAFEQLRAEGFLATADEHEDEDE